VLVVLPSRIMIMIMIMARRAIRTIRAIRGRFMMVLVMVRVMVPVMVMRVMLVHRWLLLLITLITLLAGRLPLISVLAMLVLVLSVAMRSAHSFVVAKKRTVKMGDMSLRGLYIYKDVHRDSFDRLTTYQKVR